MTKNDKLRIKKQWKSDMRTAICGRYKNIIYGFLALSAPSSHYTVVP